MQQQQLLKIILLVSSVLSGCNCQLLFLKELIQNNVAGSPVIHKEVQYAFDPEIGKIRSRQYQELNGRLGEKAIERLGLGTDGKDRERLAAQRARDQAYLDGAHDIQ